jgi:tetratricopeptide (TPR) repeat protein
MGQKMKHIIILTITLFILNSNCASREFKSTKTNDAQSNLTPAEKLKYKQAVQVVNQGNKEFQVGKYKESLSLAQKSFDTFPTSEGYYLAGVSNQKLGKNEAAANDLEAGRAIAPKNEQILITLALVKTTLGEEEEALSIYEELAQSYPKEPVYVFKKAVQEKALTKYPESLKSFKSINPDTFPQKAELYSQLGDVSMKLKNYSEAEKYFSLAEKESPNSSSLKSNKSTVKTASYLENGNKAMAAKDYNLAVEEYTKASKVDVKNPSPLVFLANAYILKSDFRNAEASLNKSLKLNEDYQPSYETYSALYYKERRYKDSIAWAKKGLSAFPKSERLFNRLGLAEWKLGDLKSATLSFRKASEINPKFVESDKNLSYLLMEDKRFRDSKLVLQSLIKKDPASTAEYDKIILFCEQSELIEKGDKFLSTGKISDANRLYAQSLKLNPNEPSVHNAYGRSYFISNYKTKAEASFQKTLSLDAENIPALIGLIRIYSSRKDAKNEKAALTKLNSLTEGDPTAGILVARLKEDEGDMKAAELSYLSLKKQYPDNPAVSYRLASLYFKNAVDKNSDEKYDEALAYLKKASKEDPNFPGIASTEKVIQENKKFDTILPLIKKANLSYDRKNFKEAAELYNSAYQKTNKPTLLVKVAECYVGMGEEEKALNLLEASARKEKTGFTDFREAIYSYYFSKGETAKAEKGFRDLLVENPASFYSYYKLGLIEMSRKNYDKAIENIDKALVLNYNFSAGNVAKGVAFYRKGDNKTAKEEFNRAMDKDPTLDIASFNIGILFFNQDMDKEARKVFQELSKKNPEFSESFHQLSYLDFKEGKIDSAEKNILKALKIDRTPAYLYAYLKILETKKDKKNWQMIAREMNEKYPSSSFTNKIQSDAFQDEPLYFQSHATLGKLISKPILIGDTMISNYGTSLVATDVRSKSRKWRTESSQKYETLVTDLRLYAANAFSLAKYDIESGQELAKVSTNLPKTSRLASFESIQGKLMLATHQDKQTFVRIYSSELKLESETNFVGNFYISASPDQKSFFLWDSSGKFHATEGTIAGVFSSEVNWVKTTDSGNTKFTASKWINENPYLLSKDGYMDDGVFNKWEIPIDSFQIESASVLLKSKDRFYEWKGSKLNEISFAKGMVSILPIEKGYITWDKLNQVRLHNESGAILAQTKAPSDWSKSNTDLATLYSQGLDLSK